MALINETVRIPCNDFEKAVSNNDIDQVNALLEKNALVIGGGCYKTIFNFVNTLEMANVLIEKGFPLKPSNNYSLLLHMAVINNSSKDLIQLYISNGFLLNPRANVGFSATVRDEPGEMKSCSVVAFAPNVEMINFLVSRGAVLEPQDRKLAIDIAVKKNRIGNVIMLSCNGVSITNQLDLVKTTKMAKALIRSGAVGSHKTIKNMLKNGGSPKLVTYLHSVGIAIPDDILIWASRKRLLNRELVEVILNTGFDINHIPQDHYHVLSYVTRVSHLKLLLEYGADPNQVYKYAPANDKEFDINAFSQYVGTNTYSLVNYLLDHIDDLQLISVCVSDDMQTHLITKGYYDFIPTYRNRDIEEMKRHKLETMMRKFYPERNERSKVIATTWANMVSWAVRRPENMQHLMLAAKPAVRSDLELVHRIAKLPHRLTDMVLRFGWVA